MLAQHTELLVTPLEREALGTAMAEPEAAVSDAPQYSPQAIGLLLLALLLSPKEPKSK